MAAGHYGSGYPGLAALRLFRQSGTGLSASHRYGSADTLMANLVMLAGWGEFFPWAVPGLYAQGETPSLLASYWIVLITGLLGTLATYLWWKYADQSR